MKGSCYFIRRKMRIKITYAIYNKFTITCCLLYSRNARYFISIKLSEFPSYDFIVCCGFRYTLFTHS